MKYYIILPLFLLGMGIQAQSTSNVFSAIGSGKAEAVSKLMDQSVELCFNDRVEFMSKSGATKALNDFFAKNPPKSFTKKHKGNSPGADSKYLIGNYESTNGNSYRVYIFTKKGKEKQMIQELRFDSVK